MPLTKFFGDPDPVDGKEMGAFKYKRVVFFTNQLRTLQGFFIWKPQVRFGGLPVETTVLWPHICDDPLEYDQTYFESDK